MERALPRDLPEVGRRFAKNLRLDGLGQFARDDRGGPVPPSPFGPIPRFARDNFRSSAHSSARGGRARICKARWLDQNGPNLAYAADCAYIEHGRPCIGAHSIQRLDELLPHRWPARL
jgi:hypothetical protein